MNISLITKILQPAAKTLGDFAAKHTTEILTAFGITLAASAIAETAVATVKTVKEVETIEEETNEKPDKKEMAKIIAKNYWPVAVTFILSGLSIGLAEKKNLEALAAINAAYLSEKRRNDIFRLKTGEIVGKTKEATIYKETEKELEKEKPPKTCSAPILTQNGETWFIDTLTGQEFKSSFAAVRTAIVKAKELIADNDYCTKNELLYFMDINQTRDGDMWVWDRYSKPDILFDPVMVNGDLTKYRIVYKGMPRLDYNK